MKKTLVALAALAVVGAASAQSSVTLFGVVDATLMVGNGDTANKTQLGNSGYNSSRLGFRGVEDLGGGLKASFWLETGMSNDSGVGAGTNTNNQASGNALAGLSGGQGLTYNRKSIVSLLGGFGEVRFGRDYTPAFWTEAVYDPFGINGVGTSRAFFGGAGVAGITAVRASNSFGYLSPNMGGFAVWAQTYLGENASNAGNIGDGSSIRLSYDKGPISLGYGYNTTKVNATGSVQINNFGGSYNFGVASLMAYVLKHQLDGAAHDVDGYLVGGLVPMGPGTIRVSFSTTDNGTAKTDQFALGYVYNLSKRTSLYGTFATLNNTGGAAAALNGASTPANGSSTGFDLGVKHSF